MHWNPVDLLLLAIVLVGAATGFSRGFLFAALDLLTLAASLAAAFLGYQQASLWLGRAAPALGVWLAPLSFVALFLLVHFILGTAALRLAQQAPNALRVTKMLMKRFNDAAMKEALTVELDHFGDVLRGPEVKEAVAAFMQKRKPDFSTFS